MPYERQLKERQVYKTLSICVELIKSDVNLKLRLKVSSNVIYRRRFQGVEYQNCSMCLSLSHTFTVMAPVELRFIPIKLVGKIGVNRDGKEENPTVSARFVYDSTTTHAGSATIHPDGATNAQECSRCGHDSIRCYYGSSQ